MGADLSGAADNPNIWYQCEDLKGNALLDADGNRIPAYSTNQAKTYGEYHSQRIPSDPGNYIYNFVKSGSVQVRICYYNYYTYKNGHEPSYIMGTDTMGRDLFCSIGMGARFSLVFALIVSAINLTIGAIYGAIQGYYGGCGEVVMAACPCDISSPMLVPAKSERFTMPRYTRDDILPDDGRQGAGGARYQF